MRVDGEHAVGSAKAGPLGSKLQLFRSTILRFVQSGGPDRATRMPRQLHEPPLALPDPGQVHHLQAADSKGRKNVPKSTVRTGLVRSDPPESLRVIWVAAVRDARLAPAGRRRGGRCSSTSESATGSFNALAPRAEYRGGETGRSASRHHRQSVCQVGEGVAVRLDDAGYARAREQGLRSGLRSFRPSLSH